MTDPNVTDFYGRVARIQKARAKGQGFEAPGALGRSYYSRPKRRQSFVLPLLLLLISGFAMKGIVYHAVGPQSYDNRVAVLMAGKGVEPIGGWMMQPEPITLFISAQITKGLAKLK